MNKIFCFWSASILLISTFTCHSANLILGVEKLDYLPFYTTENRQYKGYARELFDKFAADNKHNISYKILPVARLFHELINGKIDLKFPDNPKWKSTEKQHYAIDYSIAIIPFTDGVMVRPEDINQSQSYFYHIGTMRGFTPWPLQSKINKKTIRVTEQNSILGLLKQVILKRTDGCFINIDVAKYFLSSELKQPNALIFNKKFPSDSSHYFLSSINKTHILKQFNLWLIKNNDFHMQLRQKWGL